MGAVMFPLPAKAQGGVTSVNQTFYFSSTMTRTDGTGNGVAIGTLESGSFTLNIALLQLVGGGPNNGAAIYCQTNATAVVNGTSFENVDVGIANNVTDISGNNIPSVLFDISWGPEGNDGIVLYAPNSIVPDDSINSVQTMLNAGLSAALPYNNEATLSVGYEASGFDGAWGALTTFGSTPPSSPVLSISISQSPGETAKVFWPTNAAGFQLQTSTLLGTNWATITNQPAVAGTNYFLNFPATNTSEFFRLYSTN